MTTTLHGISNCDTVKRARAWLDERGVAYGFHDYKKSGVPDAIDLWIETLGWEALLNRQGTTWRRLDEATRAGVLDAATASAVMLAQPSVIRRPIVVWDDGAITVGFDAAKWAARG